jgi:hypothetical protein
MAAQTKALADETAVMRSFDIALQKAIALPARARGRTLRHISERLAEHLEATADEMRGLAAGLSGNGEVPAGMPVAPPMVLDEHGKAHVVPAAKGDS